MWPFYITKASNHRKEMAVLDEIRNTLMEINRKLDDQTAPNTPQNKQRKISPASRPDPDKIRRKILSDLNNFFSSRGIDEKELAKVCGLQPCNVRAFLSGTQNISKKTAGRLAEAYGLNKDYLINGEGSLEQQKPLTKEDHARIDRHYRTKYGD